MDKVHSKVPFNFIYSFKLFHVGNNTAWDNKADDTEYPRQMEHGSQSIFNEMTILEMESDS